jgi:hypothetical protein
MRSNEVIKKLASVTKKTFPTSTLHNCKRFLQRILKDPKGMNETKVDVAHLEGMGMEIDISTLS